MGKWEMVRLGDIATIVSGSTPKTSVSEYWDGQYKWVTPAEISNDTVVIYETARNITEKAIRETRLKPLPIGTVLLSSRAPIGKVALAGTEMYCNQGFKNLICLDKIYNKYLFWFLKGKKEYLNSLGRGATFKEISKTIVQNIQIPLPPLETQKQIADTLDNVAELLALRKKQLEELDKLIKSVFYDMFGDPVTNEKGWKFIELGHVAKLQGGFAFKSKDYVKTGIKLVKIANVHKDILAWEDEINYLPTNYLKEYSNYELFEGDIVLAMTRPIIKSLDTVKVAVVKKSDLPCLLNQRVGRFVISPNKINRTYLLEFCRTQYFKNAVERFASTSLQPNVSSKQIGSILCMIPPMELQNEFAEIVTKIEEQKTIVKKAIDETQHLFDSLISQYFD